MAIITPIIGTDLISASDETINANFDNLNTDKIETSTLDTDVTLASNSNAKIATQRAVKTYVDTLSNNKATLTVASSTEPSINTDTYGRYVLTTQVQDITSFTANLTGTPSDGDTLDIRITNGISTTSFVASSEYGDASSDSAVIAKPLGTADDDIMFMVIESGTAYTNALPDGWTSLAQRTSTDFYELAYRVASTEGSNYTIGFVAAQPVKITIVTYSGGFNVTNPIDTFSNTAYVVSNTSNTALSMNVTSTNSVLLFFGAVQSASAITQTKPILPTTAWTENYDSGDTNSDFWLEVASMTWTGSGATGDMTSTLSTSATNKHAFAVALRPVIGITYGASFKTNADTLPTIIQYGDTRDISLVYNSAISDWVASVNHGNAVLYNTGNATYDMSTASGTQTIAHGFGRIPKLVEMKGMTADNSAFAGTTMATYVSQTGTQSSVYNIIRYASTNSVVGNSFLISLNTSSFQTGTITVDATNISIAWVKTSTPTGTAYLTWKVQ